MFIVRATKKLLDRIGPVHPSEAEPGPNQLGEWYATPIFWRPQVALFVNERTLLPVLMPLAPAATLLERFPHRLATVLAAQEIPEPVIDGELEQMREHHLSKTASRSVVGVMNEFVHLANVFRAGVLDPDLQDLSLRLATTPCGPLYARHVRPDRELQALLRPEP
ncbi:hypothetical protein LUW76_25340 [Actinomadura madurae]|uniref:DUF6933 domain-containing protein n=1 Tax=Actinomadura madurae TaxID=1993 RepID=UPI002025ED70|nr:hypothetical protein [Actinomadura madurae]URM97410.1 hypothetical protein LUW76_25340 [Actinomadura madurae]